MKLFSLSSLLLFICLAASAGAQDASTSGTVGVDEHLGRLLPGGLTFLDEEGKEVKLESLLDKPTILSLVYFECPSICGPLLQGIVEVLNKTSMKAGEDFRVLSISFNPREGAELASRKKTNFLAALKKPIPADSWRFMTGTPENITAIAEAVGFRYVAMGKDYNHPATLTILSPEGKIVRYIPGISFVTADVEMALLQAKRGEVSSTRPPSGSTGLFAFCFTYDPVQQKRVLNITTLAGFSVLIGLGIFASVMIFTRKSDRRALPVAEPGESGQDTENGAEK